MKRLLLGISFCFLFNFNVTAMTPAQVAVQGQIGAIALNPGVNVGNNVGCVGALSEDCIRSILGLPCLERDILFRELVSRVDAIAPVYAGAPMFRNMFGPQAFAALRTSILTQIQTASAATAREIDEARLAPPPVVVQRQVQGPALAQQLPVPPRVAEAPKVLADHPILLRLDLPRDEQVVLEKIKAIPVELEIAKLADFFVPNKQTGNIAWLFQDCMNHIILLSPDRREPLILALDARMKHLKPVYRTSDLTAITNERLEEKFVEKRKDFDERLVKALEEAKNPPPPPVDERLNPIPDFVPLAAVDTTEAMLLLDAAFDPTNASSAYFGYGDPKKLQFEGRLIKFLEDHWTNYYKVGNSGVDFNGFRRLVEGFFTDIDQSTISVFQKRIAKVNFIEGMLHDMLQSNPTTIATLITRVRIFDNPVITRMEKVRELPHIDWDQLIENDVCRLKPDLRRLVGESDIAYWKRMGNHVIDVYEAIVRPHLYPPRLLDSLTGNVDVKLIPFVSMFSDCVDSSTVGCTADLFDFVVSTANLRMTDHGLKTRLEQCYHKTHDYVRKSLAQLFGTDHAIPVDLSWDWYGSGQEFKEERLELCKKVLVIFAHLGRLGEHYDDDQGLIATLVGRLTHCTDGKKTGIESTSRIAANQLKGGGALEDLGIATFDSFVKNIILGDFKAKAIDGVSAHPSYAENVSIMTRIKHRNKDFWNFPREMIPQYSHYSATDYALLEDGHIDASMQQLFQHVYAGPHQLVNVIKRYLDETNAYGRAGFFGLTCTMLARSRPFNDLQANIFDFRPLVRERYCELVVGGTQDPIHPVPVGQDYTFTREGIETILFCSGYLAWNGPKGQHPLKFDWQENIAYVRRTAPNEYAGIYKDGLE